MFADPIEVSADRARLGECPVWDQKRNALLWLDIEAGSLLRFDVSSGAVHRQTLADPVTAIALTEDPDTLVAAHLEGFALLDLRTGALRRTGPRLVDAERDRMNDGACDRCGRFWAGSLVENEGSGGLWRLDESGRVTRMLEGVTASNGLAWGPTAEHAYYVDSFELRIDTLSLSEDGTRVESRQPFATISAGDGIPDGLALDADGGVWVALWGRGRVRRYTADGDVDAEIAFPARNVSNLAFGGEDGRDLYVTTAADPQARRGDHLDGALFKVRVPYHGATVHRACLNGVTRS